MIIKMEIIDLYSLANEIVRSMRFFDASFPVNTFRYIHTIHLIPFKFIIEEKEHELSEEDINLESEIKTQDFFGGKTNRIYPLDVKGKIVALSRRDGFLEIDVSGHRNVPTLFYDDMNIVLKDPARRDIAYITNTYPDAFGLLLEEVKRRIQHQIALNRKKRMNLSRIIDYIDKLQGRKTPVERLSSAFSAVVDRKDEAWKSEIDPGERS